MKNLIQSEEAFKRWKEKLLLEDNASISAAIVKRLMIESMPKPERFPTVITWELIVKPGGPRDMTYEYVYLNDFVSNFA